MGPALRLKHMRKRAMVYALRKYNYYSWRALSWRFGLRDFLVKKLYYIGVYPLPTMQRFVKYYFILRILWIWPFLFTADSGAYGLAVVPGKLLQVDLLLVILGYFGLKTLYTYQTRRNIPWPHLVFRIDHTGWRNTFNWRIEISWYIARPAMINGVPEYSLHHHRIGKPAFSEYLNGKLVSTSWHYNDALHRFDGPASQAEQGEEYILFGGVVTPKQFKRLTEGKTDVEIAIAVLRRTNKLFLNKEGEYHTRAIRQRILSWMRENGHKRLLKQLKAAARLRR